MMSSRQGASDNIIHGMLDVGWQIVCLASFELMGFWLDMQAL